MNYKAVIFDLDGTLLDTLEDIADSCNIVLEESGFPVHPVSEYKKFVGRGIRHLIKRMLPVSSITDTIIEDVRLRVSTEYLKRLTNKTRPYPGIIKTLSELESKGIIMSVLSNKPQDMVRQTLKELLPQFRFKVVMGKNDRFPHKPDPGSTHYEVCRMNRSAEDTVFVGDSDIDMLTAKNAGLDSIGAGWGFRTIHNLRAAGAVHIVLKPEELLEFF